MTTARARCEIYERARAALEARLSRRAAPSTYVRELNRFAKNELAAWLASARRRDVDASAAAAEYGAVYERLLALRPDADPAGARLVDDDDVRKRVGAYFTPSAVAELVVRETVGAPRGSKRLRILDPAAGPGVFLAAAARLLGKARCRLTAIDRDPGALALCHATLAGLAKTETLALDALRSNHVALQPARYDVVVGNPPFLSVKRGALKELDATLRRRFRSARGQYDAWALFLERTLSVLKPGGRFGLILPSPVLTAESHAPIRRILLEEARLERVIALGQCFRGVAVEAIALVGQRAGAGRARQLTFVDATPPASPTRPRRFTGARSSSFAALRHAVIPFGLSDDDADFLGRLAAAETRLGDLVAIQRGLEIGKSHPAVGCGSRRRGVLTGDQVDAFTVDAPLALDSRALPAAKQKPHPSPGRPTLLVRRVTDTLLAAVDPRGAETLNTLYRLTPRDEADDDLLYAVAALLNSRAMRRYHRLLHGGGERLFPYVRASQLAALPVPAGFIDAVPALARAARGLHAAPAARRRAALAQTVDRAIETARW